MNIAKQIINNKRDTRGQIEDRRGHKSKLAKLIFKEININPDEHMLKRGKLKKEYQIDEETIRTEIVGKNWALFWDSTPV